MASIEFLNNDLQDVAQQYSNLGNNAEEIINETLHGFGANIIKQNIQNILPISGRTWSGKAKSAKSAKPFTQENKNLYLKVKSKTNYNYLYFPNDGTNTKRHQGKQFFMQRGAEDSIEEFKNECINNILERIDG